MQAACYGHLASVQLLLQSRAKVNIANSWGATALVGAAQGGFLTVVQVASVFVCGCSVFVCVRVFHNCQLMFADCPVQLADTLWCSDKL